MSLMDELLTNRVSPMERMAQIAQLMPQSQGRTPSDPTSLMDFTGGQGASQAEAQRIADFIRSKGFSVGGLENYGGTGQVSSGHITNSQHYTGHAGDVSYMGDGRWANEPAALDWLYNKLNKRFGDSLTELIWRAPDHYDHLHYGTRPGG